MAMENGTNMGVNFFRTKAFFWDTLLYSAYENKTITINQEGLYIDIQVRADVLNSWPLYTSA